jgi:hypothetical protein
MYPSDFRSSPRPIRLTLLAALCAMRAGEITDGLVDLLIALVLKIDTRAERRVEGELINDLKRVRGKEGILFRLAEAALEQPDETVRRALYPVVGEGMLRELVREARANEAAFRQRVRTVLRSSYSGHYRRMLAPLLATLEFRSNNSAYGPVMDAIDLLRRYAPRPGQDRWYDEEERSPSTAWCPWSGGRRWSTSMGAWSGSRTSSAYSRRCATPSAGESSTWPVPTAGGTWKTISRPTSNSTGTSTTTPCDSHSTPPRSSPSCSAGTGPP